MCFCCICCTLSDFILYIVAIIFPPIAVALRSGIYSSDFLLNALLTIFGFLPGMIHAFYYITITSPLRRDPEMRYFYEQGWVDGQRYGSPGGIVEQQPSSVSAPLLPPNSQNTAVKRSFDQEPPKGPPPPYTDIV